VGLVIGSPVPFTSVIGTSRKFLTTSIGINAVKVLVETQPILDIPASSLPFFPPPVSGDTVPPEAWVYRVHPANPDTSPPGFSPARILIVSSGQSPTYRS